MESDAANEESEEEGETDWDRLQRDVDSQLATESQKQYLRDSQPELDSLPVPESQPLPDSHLLPDSQLERDSHLQHSNETRPAVTSEEQTHPQDSGAFSSVQELARVAPHAAETGRRGQPGRLPQGDSYASRRRQRTARNLQAMRTQADDVNQSHSQGAARIQRMKRLARAERRRKMILPRLQDIRRPRLWVPGMEESSEPPDETDSQNEPDDEDDDHLDCQIMLKNPHKRSEVDSEMGEDPYPDGVDYDRHFSEVGDDEEDCEARKILHLDWSILGRENENEEDAELPTAPPAEPVEDISGPTDAELQNLVQSGDVDVYDEFTSFIETRPYTSGSRSPAVQPSRPLSPNAVETYRIGTSLDGADERRPDESMAYRSSRRNARPARNTRSTNRISSPAAPGQILSSLQGSGAQETTIISNVQTRVLSRTSVPPSHPAAVTEPKELLAQPTQKDLQTSQKDGQDSFSSHMTESTNASRYGMRKDGTERSKQGCRRHRRKRRRESGDGFALKNSGPGTTIEVPESPQSKGPANESSAAITTSPENEEVMHSVPVQRFTATNSPPRQAAAAGLGQSSGSTFFRGIRYGTTNPMTTVPQECSGSLLDRARTWTPHIPPPPRHREPSPPPKLPFDDDDEDSSSDSISGDNN